MDFLERFGDRDRERLLEASVPVRLSRGEYLLRRGEKGGDVYRVAEGELEIIDNRSQPAVVLDVIGRGAMVGEMAFLEDQVRTADVRAAENSVLQRWDRRSLMRILDADPTFAAGFYRSLAGLAVDRARSITTTAMAGALAGSRTTPGNEAAAAQGRRLAAGLRDRLLEIEPSIRRDRAAAYRDLLAALHTFGEAVHSTFARFGEDDAVAAGTVMARELHPYLMRSHLGESAIDKAEGHCGDTWTVAHVLHGQPKGDGPLGEMFDEWLLGLPTARAFRERRALLASLLTECLPTEPPFRILAVGACSAAAVVEPLEHLARLGGELVAVDGSRDALSCVDSDLHARARTVKLRLVHDDLAAFALGRPRVRYQPQHVLIADGLLEYLPERVAISLLRTCREHVAPGGHLLVATAAPATDEVLFRFLLSWPMVRRTPASLSELFVAAGLPAPRTYEAGSAGIVAMSPVG